jgi:hypothetical protein
MANFNTTSRLVTITPDPASNAAANTSATDTQNGYYPIVFGLIEHSSYGPVSSGGWQVIDRPKQVAATQWFDRSPYKIDLNLILDKSVTGSQTNMLNTVTKDNPYGDLAFGGNNPSVENDCLQLEKWVNAVPNTYQPPVLEIDGPLPGTTKNWILFSLEFNDAIRDFTTGDRTQQLVKATLYEYNAPLASTNIQNFSHAAAWVQNTIDPNFSLKSSKLYTVKIGDTIESVAASNNSTVEKIQNANGIRDPKSFEFLLGSTIIIPGSVQ